MNESTDAIRYTYSMASLCSNITGAMDVVATPAEFGCQGLWLEIVIGNWGQVPINSAN